MFSSIRARLTGWYSLVLACVLVAFACATYFLVERNFVKRSDTAIVDQADSFLRTVNAELDDPAEQNSIDGTFRSALFEHSSRDTRFLVIDSAGRVFGTVRDGDPHSEPEPVIPDDAAAFRQAAQTKPDGSFNNVRLGRRLYRAYLRRFPANNTEFTLAVLHATHEQREFLETLSGTFAVVIPASVLLVALGGYFLARRSLQPVAMMGRQAGLISAESLHRRLEIQNPKDELGTLAGSFNQLLDRLDLAFAQQRRFIADASHELRTPVAILFGESDVALSQPSRTAQEYRESLEILRVEAGRLKVIIEDLFTLARADAGQYRLTKTRFHLEELVAECIRSMRSLASRRGLSLHFDCGADEMPIVADEAFLRRMFFNVMDNALKYTPAGGSVRVSCMLLGDGYYVSVEDTGKGISPELQEKIFERFFRADPSRSRFENNGGAGLGLSISRLIATAHGGDLLLSRSDGTGSTFTIRLPESSPDIQRSQAPSQTNPGLN